MKIENLRTERNENRARVAATVSWEDCDRPSYELFFETEEVFAESISCNPHAFLLACAIPAMYYGEKRLFIDAEICPTLKDGLICAMSWLRNWWYELDRGHVHIESKGNSCTFSPRKSAHAGFFFSGGIDSFATLFNNRQNFPSEHPRSIKDGLVVYGLELDNPKSFEYVVQSLSSVSKRINVELIPVYTNLYLEYRNEDAANGWRLWTQEFCGAALAAIAHAFARRFSFVSIAASIDIPTIPLKNRQNVKPLGSHPLLDPSFSSCDLQILSDGLALSRLDKTKLLAQWDVALQNLRVCNNYKLYRPGKLNCGKCEKCVRTMLALLALDLLENTDVFGEKDVSRELLTKVNITHETTVDKYTLAHYYYEPLIQYLKKRNRYDLAHVIESIITESYFRKNNVKKIIKTFRSKYLKNHNTRYKKAISHNNNIATQY